MNNPLLDDDGENRAVRWFLEAYGGNHGLTVGAMQKHMSRCGYPLWPKWCDVLNEDRHHLTKGGAQLWLRYLFDLEKISE